MIFISLTVRVTLRKNCTADTQSNFLSEETKNGVNTLTSVFVKYDGKFASRCRAKPLGVLCVVLPWMLLI